MPTIFDTPAPTAAPVQLAQAAEPIGRVDTLDGAVAVIRTDGSRETLARGGEIFQGDVLETGSDGAVGVVLADGSVFSLGENGKLAMDEMVYDPGAGEGSATISLLTGAATFVSGQIAKMGQDAMVVNTPVATIGIRGTKVFLDTDGTSIRAVNLPETTLRGEGIGEIVLYAADGTQIGTANSLGAGWSWTPSAGAPTSLQLTPGQVDNLITEISVTLPRTLEETVLDRVQELTDKREAAQEARAAAEAAKQAAEESNDANAQALADAAEAEAAAAEAEAAAAQAAAEAAMDEASQKLGYELEMTEDGLAVDGEIVGDGTDVAGFDVAAGGPGEGPAGGAGGDDFGGSEDPFTDTIGGLIGSGAGIGGGNPIDDLLGIGINDDLQQTSVETPADDQTTDIVVVDDAEPPTVVATFDLSSLILGDTNLEEEALTVSGAGVFVDGDLIADADSSITVDDGAALWVGNSNGDNPDLEVDGTLQVDGVVLHEEGHVTITGTANVASTGILASFDHLTEVSGSFTNSGAFLSDDDDGVVVLGNGSVTNNGTFDVVDADLDVADSASFTNNGSLVLTDDDLDLYDSASFTNSGTTIVEDYMYLNDDASATNDGTLAILDGYFYSFAEGSSGGTSFVNNDYFSLVDGYFYAYEESSITNNGQMEISDYMYLYDDTEFTNNGEIYHSYTTYMYDNAIYNNYGNVVQPEWYVYVYDDAEFHNYGTYLQSYDQFLVYEDGLLHNHAGGFMATADEYTIGQFVDGGYTPTVINEGTMNVAFNYFELRSQGVLINEAGATINVFRGDIEIDGTATNSGTMIASDGESGNEDFYVGSSGVLTNTTSGIIRVDGTLENDGTINNQGTIEAGWFENNGTLTGNAVIVHGSADGDTMDIFDDVTDAVTGTAVGSSNPNLIGNATNTGSIYLQNSFDVGGTMDNDGAIWVSSGFDVGSLDNSGEVHLRSSDFDATNDVVNTGLLSGGSNISAGGNLTNSGQVLADNNVLIGGQVINAVGATIMGYSIDIGGGLDNDGAISSESDLNVTAGAVDNAGILFSGGDIWAEDASLTNTGDLAADESVLANGDLTNSGHLFGDSGWVNSTNLSDMGLGSADISHFNDGEGGFSFAVFAAGDILNQTGGHLVGDNDIDALGDLINDGVVTLDGDINVAGLTNNSSGAIVADGDLQVYDGDLVNYGDLAIEDDIDVEDDVYNYGVMAFAEADVHGNFENHGVVLVSLHDLQVDGDLYNAGTITAADDTHFSDTGAYTAVFGGGAAGSMITDGTLTLDGDLDIQFDTAVAEGESYNLFTANEGIYGAFDSITYDDIGSGLVLDPIISGDGGTTVDLVVRAVDDQNYFAAGDGGETLTAVSDGIEEVLIGGDGNDILALSLDDFHFLDGGDGTDTLVLAETLDLTQIRNDILQDIEIVDAGAFDLTLDADDALGMVSREWDGGTGAYDRLTIDRGLLGTIDFQHSALEWTQGTDGGYTTYTNDTEGVEVYIQSGILL